MLQVDRFILLKAKALRASHDLSPQFNIKVSIKVATALVTYFTKSQT